MKIIEWIKHRISHKLEHFSPEKIKTFLKKNGLAFVIIFLAWEIIEDIIFPILFVFLGNYIHPVFYAGAPASVLLCFHWIAVPLTWGLWLRITGRKVDT